MNRKMLILLSIGIVLIVAGVTLTGVYSLAIDEWIGDDEVGVHITGAVVLQDKDGNTVLTPSLVGGAVTSDGNPVKYLDITVNWTASGSIEELVWSTFMITFTHTLEVSDQYWGTLTPQVVTFMEDTSIFESGQLTWNRDIESLILGALGHEAVREFGAGCRYTIDVRAQIDSIYGETKEQTGSVVVEFALGWNEPELSFTVGGGVGTWTTSSISGSNAIFSMLPLALVGIGFIVMAFIVSKRKLVY